MKRFWSFSVMFLLVGIYTVTAKDYVPKDFITQINSDVILAKVVEVTSTEVLYRRYVNDNLEGTIRSIPIKKVRYIRYLDGSYNFLREEKARIEAEELAQKNNDKLIFGINANAGGAIPLGNLGASAPSFNIEFTKGNFNSEVNFIYSIDFRSKAMGFGSLATFNYVWNIPIGSFFFGGGLGYIYIKFGEINMHDIALGGNIAYNYPLQSGVYFRIGTFVGGKILVINEESDFKFFLKPTVGVGYSFK